MAAHNIPLIISNTEGLNEMFNEQHGKRRYIDHALAVQNDHWNAI
jgi:hypothetical protein